MHVLLLAHRIPYPPDKGDKIRSFNLLQHLARNHRVSLGAFVDDPNDWMHKEALEAICSRSHLIPLRKARSLLWSVTALLRGLPLSVPYYASSSMSRWVTDLDETDPIDCAIAYSSTMAQFMIGLKRPSARRIVDLVDVDSDKWRQYAAQQKGLRRWVFEREHRTLSKYEKTVVENSDRAFLVSATEAELLRSNHPALGHRIDWYGIGVDTAYFDPSVVTANNDTSLEPSIVFTGAMDYWPNIDAVQWFVASILPLIHARNPNVRLLIVGRSPTNAVLALASNPKIFVSGRVPDVRPYLHSANVAIAPLRIARGVQSKILEAMAMALPVISTSNVVAGLALSPALDVTVADEPGAFAQAVLDRLNGGRSEPNRRFVKQNFSWPAQFARLDAHLKAPMESC